MDATQDLSDPSEGEAVSLLERLRYEKGVSLGQVVADTGVMHKTIRRYERDPMYYPNATALEKLASYYGVTATEILRNMRAQIRASEAAKERDAA